MSDRGEMLTFAKGRWGAFALAATFDRKDKDAKLLVVRLRDAIKTKLDSGEWVMGPRAAADREYLLELVDGIESEIQPASGRVLALAMRDDSGSAVGAM